jgi:hypothetical protein
MSNWASQIEEEESPAIPGRTGSEDAQLAPASKAGGNAER